MTVPVNTPVALGVYVLERGLSSLGSFAVFESCGLVNWPRLTATLTKTLKPWTGSNAQVVAAFSGSSISDALYDFAWSVSMAVGDQAGSPKTAYVQGQTEVSSFIINLQPYYLSWTVAMQEQYWAFDFGDALTQILTYINAAKLLVGWALSSSVWVPVVAVSMRLAAAAARKGNLAEAAKDLAAARTAVQEREEAVKREKEMATMRAADASLHLRTVTEDDDDGGGGGRMPAPRGGRAQPSAGRMAAWSGDGSQYSDGSRRPYAAGPGAASGERLSWADGALPRPPGSYALSRDRQQRPAGPADRRRGDAGRLPPQLPSSRGGGAGRRSDGRV